MNVEARKEDIMNPYIEIVKRHLTTEDLEMLLAETKNKKERVRLMTTPFYPIN